MLRTDEQWRSVADRFAAAALGGDWLEALNGLADACGAEKGELIGVGSDTAVPFNWMTRVDMDMDQVNERFRAIGGGDPAVNPRVRVGIRAPIMQAWHEVQCSTEEQLRVNFAYADFCRDLDIPFGSQTTLLRQDGMLIGLAVLRGQRRGLPPPEDRRAFELLSSHVRSAVLTQMALEGQGAAMVGGALEAVGAAAFVCDALGRVRALTAAAEAKTAEGVIRLKGGRLGAVRSEDAARLELAIAAAAAPNLRPEPPSTRTVVLRGRGGPMDIEVVDVFPLPPQPFAFGFEPRVLVVARGAGRRSSDLAAVLAQAYGLTPTEADIAVRVADGQPREQIAGDRGISVETVRSHIKSIFTKLDVRRESQLGSRLRRFE